MKRITFKPRGEFYIELKRKVNDYFETRKINKTGDRRLYFKTIVSVLLFTSSYASFYIFNGNVWHGIICGIGVAFGSVMISFNVMHDANHSSYSHSKRLNHIFGYFANLLGGSRILWRRQHNSLHHTYTNIHQMDTDLGSSNLFRFAPNQDLRKWHRFQFLYAFFFYCFLLFSWVVTDIYEFVDRKVKGHPLAKPSKFEVFLFIFFKCLYLFYMFVLPMWLLPLSTALAFILVSHFLSGLIMSVVFQLAHVTEAVTFPEPDECTGKMANDWAIHQVETTADFGTANRILTFFCGGLNFQVEHHLFSAISHVHYFQINKILRAHCTEYGVNFREFKSMSAALISHLKLLFRLGRQ